MIEGCCSRQLSVCHNFSERLCLFCEKYDRVKPSSHHQHAQDKTVLPCLVAVGWTKSPTTQEFTIFSSPRRISRLDKTGSKLSVSDSLDLSPILFTSPTRTRLDDTILSLTVVSVGGLNYALQYRRRKERIGRDTIPAQSSRPTISSLPQLRRRPVELTGLSSVQTCDRIESTKS